MVSVPKPYVLRSKTVCFWFGNRTVLGRRTYGFGTENVKGRQLETDSIPFDHTLIHGLLNKLSNEIKTVSIVNQKMNCEKHFIFLCTFAAGKDWMPIASAKLINGTCRFEALMIILFFPDILTNSFIMTADGYR